MCHVFRPHSFGVPVIRHRACRSSPLPCLLVLVWLGWLLDLQSAVYRVPTFDTGWPQDGHRMAAEWATILAGLAQASRDP